jgi:hypothetical protein
MLHNQATNGNGMIHKEQYTLMLEASSFPTLGFHVIMHKNIQHRLSYNVYQEPTKCT